MSEPRYSSPEALRRAVTDRLRKLAQQRPDARLSELWRQFAYDRLLARVFTAEPDRWVLKGAAAMLARLPAAARHSKDIDLYSRQGDLREAETALRKAAALDIGDYFRLTLGPARPLTQGGSARRVPITAYLGPRVFEGFPVDLVASLSMTGEPEKVPPLIDIDIGLPQPRYRAYPVADHIADKVCALLEIHPRQSGEVAASTRYRDLVDLVDLATFARSSHLDGEALARALQSESDRRGLALPHRLPDPTGPHWRAGYARSARDAPSLADQDLDAALRTVHALLDPVLGGEHLDHWDPARLSWSS